MAQTEERKLMNRALREKLVPDLRARGFKGSLPHFHRIKASGADYLTIQFWSAGGRFTVEIAKCGPPTFRSGCGSGHRPNVESQTTGWHLEASTEGGRMFRFKQSGLGNTALAAAALLIASCQSPGEVASGGDAEIRAIHQARLAAILNSDFNTLENILADDFVVTFPNGTVGNKASYLGGQRSGRLLMTSATHDDERIRVYGDAAIITGRTTGKLLVEGKEQPLLIRYTHVYVKQSGKWRMMAQHTSPIPR